MTTINDLSSTDTLQSADTVPVWRAANSDTRKMTLATLLAFMQVNLDFIASEANSGMFFAVDYLPSGYIESGSTADVSTEMQTGLLAAASGMYILPVGTIYCGGLIVPTATSIVGVSQRTSILKLPAAKNTYILASAGWVNNTTVADQGGNFERFRLDGNRTVQSSNCDVWVLKTFQARVENVAVWSGYRYGILLTASNSDGSLGAANNMANNIFDKISVTDCASEGFYGQDHSSKLADGEIKNSNIYGNGLVTGTWNIRIERAAGWQFTNNQCYRPGDSGNVYLQLCAGTRVIGNHIDVTNADLTSGTCIALKMEFATLGWASSPVVGNDIFTAKETLNGTEVYKLAEFSSAVAGAQTPLVGNTFRIVDNLAGALTWTSTGTLQALDVGNAYLGYAVQPDPSANVLRGWTSNSSGTWTLDEALTINASLTQEFPGGSSTFRSIAGEGITQSLMARYSTDTTAPSDALQKAGGTIAAPADVLTSYEIGRRSWQARASGSFREVARDTVFIRTASPSSTDLAAGRYFLLAPDGSATMTEFMSMIYSVGLGMYGSTVIDAGRGIRYPSFDSTALDAIANAVNTANKAAGKTVWNSTVSKLVSAVGSTAGSVWVDGAGTTINTPV